MNDAKTARYPYAKNKLDPYILLYIKTGSKCIKARTIKLFEENIDINLYDLELSNELLRIIPKAWETKEEKKINLTSLKLKTFML